jgi:uncharacterized Fe-S center protein
MAKVYFLDLRKGYKDNVLVMLDQLMKKAGGMDIIKNGGRCAVKTHFGEDGNINFVSPLYVRRIVDAVRKAKGKPFLTDTTTLYGGRRLRADTHLELAKEHGFDFAPVIIGDGLHGDDYTDIKGSKIGRLYTYTDTMVCVSHFKGHLVTGFGGTLKNIGMGCASKGGKLDMHSGSKPHVEKDHCTLCLRCIEYCAFDAIKKTKESAVIDHKVCTGCAGCMSICPERAIRFNWSASSTDLQKKIGRYAARVSENMKIFYLNFLIDISPNCDCFHTNDPMIAPDVGILASFDPVSIDQACYDMVKESIDRLHPEIDATEQLAYAAQYGAGEREYEIISI